MEKMYLLLSEKLVDLIEWNLSKEMFECESYQICFDDYEEYKKISDMEYEEKIKYFVEKENSKLIFWFKEMGLNNEDLGKIFFEIEGKLENLDQVNELYALINLIDELCEYCTMSDDGDIINGDPEIHGSCENSIWGILNVMMEPREVEL